MLREKLNTLKTWQTKHNRKPLIVNGARQVGKSWLIRHFGDTYFERGTIVVNFEKQREVHAIFTPNLDVKRILVELELVLGVKILSGKNLLFFDEIQACPLALGSLRYFYEDFPELHLIAAGSLLDFEFRNQPFPVGRIETMNLYPMNFLEFLMATGDENLAEFLRNGPSLIAPAVETKLLKALHTYMIVGGMPECVQYYQETQDFLGLKEIQNSLLYTYQQDFRKYKPEINSDCLLDIIDNGVKNVGNQTIYTKLSDRFSSPTIKKGLDLLVTARLFQVVQNVSIAALPFSPNGKQFKIYFLDIGLMLRKRHLDIGDLYVKNQLLSVYEGTIAEQFVAQQLISHLDRNPNYWARTEAGANAEIDFVVNMNQEIIPIEVKAGTSGSLKSLHYLLSKYDHIEKALVYSTSRYGMDDKIRFVPIYFAGIVQKLPIRTV